ncbi:MAG: tRNA (adenosine(37)-N6)-dimethylallyltransferase MiaA [Candidatus Dormibacteria bacterium]
MIPGRGAAAPLVAVVGPTAAGKTALAVRLAAALSADIVSFDSRQVYRGIEIASNAPTADELEGIVCHLVGVLGPTEPVNAARYDEMAFPLIRAMMAEGRAVVLTAGTGLYLRATLEGLDLGGAPADPVLRRQLEAEAAVDLAGLYRRLAALAPAVAARTEATNPVRVVRRMELALRGPAAPADRHHRAALDAVMVGLDVPRPVLHQRIAARIDRMIERGLLEEVAALDAAGVIAGSQALRGIGVLDMVAHLRGQTSLREARERMAASTRAYARRQLTWFHADRRVHWFDPAARAASDIVGAVTEMMA